MAGASLPLTKYNYFKWQVSMFRRTSSIFLAATFVTSMSYANPTSEQQVADLASDASAVAGQAVDIVKAQQDVRMATLMADYLRLSMMLMQLKFTTSAGLSINGISDPTAQMLVQSGVIGVELTATGYGLYHMYKSGRSLYAGQRNIRSVVNPDQYNAKGRVGKLMSRIRAAGLPAAKTAVIGGAVYYFWREAAPVLFLNQEDYQDIFKATEADLAIVDAQLSEQARQMLGLAPRATTPATAQEIFKID